MSKEEYIYNAKLAEQAERYEDMVNNMKQVIGGDDLTIEERNLLSVAFKNSVGSRRTAWRALSSIEAKEEKKGSQNLDLIKEYKAKVEKELEEICHEIVNILDEKLIPNANGTESKIFFAKMKADYYRYMAEYQSGEKKDASSQGALKAYEEASSLAESNLASTHPIRLGLVLNFSVFYYEIMNDPKKACELAKTSFDNAIGDLDGVPEDQYKDCTTIMQLLRDNLTLWTSDMEENEGQDDGTNVQDL